MAGSLSNIVDNLVERIHKIKYKECYCFLEYEYGKHDLIFWAPGSAWQASLIKTEVKLDLLTDTDMLLMVEKKN